MPFKEKIAEVGRAIESALGALVAMRERGADKATTGPLLARLARLKDERLKLMERNGTALVAAKLRCNRVLEGS